MRNKFLIFAAGAAGLAAGARLVRRRRTSYTGPVLGLGPNGRPGLAVITGGSRGIGAAFAHRLAAQGYDLLLVARHAETLHAVGGELMATHPVSVETLAADLAQAEEVEQVAKKVEAAPDLALLVNNAGFGLSGKFYLQDLDQQLAMMRVHVEASVRLARAALPCMVARRHGGIVNVASLAAFVPLPGNAMYCATKAFLVMFTESLAGELRGTGVRVQALCPGFVRMAFTEPVQGSYGESGSWPDVVTLSVDDVVGDCLRALRSGEVICVPGAGYGFVAMLARTIPTSMLLREAVRLAMGQINQL